MLSSWPCWMFTSNSSAVVDAQRVSPLKKKSVLTLWLGDFWIQFEYPNIVQSILTRTQRFIATSVDHYHYHDSAIRVGKLGRHVNNKNTCKCFLSILALQYLALILHGLSCSCFWRKPAASIGKASSVGNRIAVCMKNVKRCMLYSTTL